MNQIRGENLHIQDSLLLDHDQLSSHKVVPGPKDNTLPELNDPRLKSKQKLSVNRNTLYGRIQMNNKEAALSQLTDSMSMDSGARFGK